MDKFNEILKYLVARERILAQQIVIGANNNQMSDTIISNIAHTEVKKLLDICADLIQEDTVKQQKLRLIK